MKKILLFLFLFTTLNILCQTQLGADIEGVSTGDEFGSSVSLSADGSVLAIGAPLNDFIDTDAGLVRVYQFNNGTMSWEQRGNDIYGEAADDKFGQSVSLSDDGSILAIGGPFNDGNGIDAGHVKVYSYNTNTNTWDQLGAEIQGDLNTGDALTGDRLGYSVTLSSDGSILAIGSPFYRLGDGRIHLYSYNTNTNAWDPLGSNNSIEGFGRFGFSVSLSTDGLTIAVGAILNGAGGSVRMYTYNTTTDMWEQVGSAIFGESNGDDSGYSVSLSSDGSVVAIGAPFNNGSGPSSGHTRIYGYNSGAGDWEQLGSDLDGENAADDSGIAVSLSADGNIVAIGARANEDSSTSFAGHVRIYQYNGVTEVWEQAGVDIDGASSSFSGSAVSLSSDGSIVAIGGPFFGGTLGSAGHVRVYGLSDVLSIDDVLLQRTRFYPNPTKNEFTIQLNGGIQFQKVRIYNQLGQLVKLSTTETTNVRELSSGLYFVEINTDQGISTKKLVIE